LGLAIEENQKFLQYVKSCTSLLRDTMADATRLGADRMKTLTILGSTGSIGTNTLDVVRRSRHLYQVYALAAGRNVEALASQILEFQPKVAVAASPAGLKRLAERLNDAGLPCSEWPQLLMGPAALVEIATASEADTVVSAIVGVAGLEATYEAVRCGKRVGLANKEVLVSGGQLVMDAVREYSAELLPIDSEHNGAHQCLRAGNRSQVSKLILTASGGPFRNTPREALAYVTPEQALNHPTWRMGNRITIDSATLMNKGFEVIEACWLFDFRPAQVDVVIHPQSTVHAMIEYTDGSVLAQIAATDMRMPIQYALTYPDRAEAPVPKIDWLTARQWDFLPPDFAKFPLLKLAYECLDAGGSATCTLNAADEIAVEAFLEGRIPFTAIWEVVQETLSKMPVRQPATVGEILEIDRESRALARELVGARTAAAMTAAVTV
jgi:1-deoxy-D-xylulose-5-phosphate reductoisomerase